MAVDMINEQAVVHWYLKDNTTTSPSTCYAQCAGGGGEDTDILKRTLNYSHFGMQSQYLGL